MFTIKAVHLVLCFFPCYVIIAHSKSKHPEYNAWFLFTGVAKLLLEYGAGINTHSNEFKESALTLACYKGMQCNPSWEFCGNYGNHFMLRILSFSDNRTSWYGEVPVGCWGWSGTQNWWDAYSIDGGFHGEGLCIVAQWTLSILGPRNFGCFCYNVEG